LSLLLIPRLNSEGQAPHASTGDAPLVVLALVAEGTGKNPAAFFAPGPTE